MGALIELSNLVHLCSAETLNFNYKTLITKLELQVIFT